MLHTCMIIWVWRYDKACGKLAHHPPPPPPPRTSLCPHVWHTLTSSFGAAASYTCPAPLRESRISAVTQHPTNELRWERLGSVVGTLLPSLLAVPGNQRCLREGPPSRPLSEWNTKQKLSPTGELHESMLVFLKSIIFPSPSIIPIHGWHTALFFWQEWKKKGQRKRKKQNNQSVGTFPCSFFFFRDLLSELTLLTPVFVHLWHRINGSASSLCAKISTVSYF